jgi:hypothetical protein
LDVSALLGSGLLQSMSPSAEAKSLQQATQLLLNGPGSGTAAPAGPATDSYTPSSQGQTPTSIDSSPLAPAGYQYTMELQAPLSDPTAGSLKITVSSSMPSVLPPAVSSAVANAVTPEQTAWGTLEQSLASGDVASAQSALNAYNQILPSSNLYMSSATTPSAQFLGDLTAVGSALASGDVTGAQAAFQTAQADHPQSVAAAVSSARGNLLADTTDAVQALADSSNLSGVDYGQLSTDQTNLDSLSREQSANISDYLATQGYSAANASMYANAVALPVDTISMSAVNQDGTEVGISSLTNYLTNVSISSSAERSAAAGVSTGNGTATDASGNVNAFATISETTSAVTDVSATINSASVTGIMSQVNSSVIENATATTSIGASVSENGTAAGNAGSTAAAATGTAAIAGSESAAYVLTGSFENFNPSTFEVTGFAAETSVAAAMSSGPNQNTADAPNTAGAQNTPGAQNGAAGQTGGSETASAHTHNHGHSRPGQASNSEWMNDVGSSSAANASALMAANAPATRAVSDTASNTLSGGWDTASYGATNRTQAWLVSALGTSSFISIEEASSATVSVYA